MAEIGRIGQKRYGGVFYEEFLRELQGIKGIKTYREMADNDDTVGATFLLLKCSSVIPNGTLSPEVIRR